MVKEKFTMANLKNITELPVAESADGLNLIVNDNGAAKQIAASAVGAQADFSITDENSPAFIKNKPAVVQADWAETDENSPAYVKNKPVEEWDVDIEIIGTFIATDDEGNEDDMEFTHTINSINTFENIKNKILNGIQPKVKIKISTTGWGNINSSYRYTESYNSAFAAYYPEWDDAPGGIAFYVNGNSTSPHFVLLFNNTIVDVYDDR